MISIAIVDDHRLFNEGISSLLREYSNIRMVGQFQDAESFLESLPKLHVDIVLMDIDLPGISGINATIQAKKINPELKVIMLSLHSDFATIQECMKLNVSGYLLKTSGSEEVVKAVLEVNAGIEYFSSEVKDTLIRSFRSDKTEDEIILTPREKEILLLICREYTTQEIADQLFISPNTVETHRKNLLSKTSSRNVTGLVKFALENKLI